jgi:hypothetical protein
VQQGLLGRLAVVVGFSIGSALLGLYFIAHYFMVSTCQRSVIELIAAAGLLLGAAGGAVRAVELAHESPSVRKTRAGAEDSLQRVWGAGLIGLVVGSCVGLIGGISLDWPRAGVAGFAVGLGILTAGVCAGIFLAARRSRRRL